MLKEAYNNNDCGCSKCVLNKALNRNGTMAVANNVRLSTMGAKQFSMTAVYLVIRQKANLPEMRDNDMKTTKVKVDQNVTGFGKIRQLRTKINI